ncbi:beta-1,3-galactosyltransferase 1-like isoform X2 [Artemia franciscana]|uniref:Hexosyltransferase n=2 Tax=Artemia franciscana TaxID=6661 RepID=A0AA88L965_ARTSF|nr:hypothetical protein QYM36_003875 [Artemia franciscana]
MDMLKAVESKNFAHFESEALLEDGDLEIDSRGREVPRQRNVFKRLCRVCTGAIVVLVIIGYIPLLHYVALKQETVQFSWNVNQSRNVSSYIMPQKNTAIIPNGNLCKTALPYILVIVPSAVSEIDARLAIRDTWGSAFKNSSYNGHNLVLAFIVGRPLNSSLESRIIAENNAFNDIIQEDFIDTYENLTLKSVMLLKWADTYCKGAEFVLKIDDDVYLDLDNLLNLLNMYGKKRLIGGSLFCNAAPIRSQSSKWYCPKHIFPGSVYPPYVSGTTYVMSGDIIHSLYETALSTPLVHLEDVFLTGIVAQKLNIFPVHFSLINHGKVELRACEYKKHVTVHDVQPSEMRFIWSESRLPAVSCATPDFKKMKVTGCNKGVSKLTKLKAIKKHRSAIRK